MDCVTCILVGMCVMCGPGFGAQAPGRPMTEAELNTALESLLRRFQAPKKPPSVSSSASYSRRQSFVPDLRFTDIGIGKRNNHPVLNNQNNFANRGDQLLNLFQTAYAMGESNNGVAGGLGDRGTLTSSLLQSVLNRGIGLNRATVKGGSIEQRLRGNSNGVLDVQSLVKNLRLSKLEQLLLKKVTEGKHLAAKLENLKADGDDDDGHNDEDDASGCH